MTSTPAKFWSQAMAENGKNQPEAAGFERQDLSAWGLCFLVGLAAVMAVVRFCCGSGLPFMDATRASTNPHRARWCHQRRLTSRQVSPDRDQRNFPDRVWRRQRANGDQRLPVAGRADLKSYGWVDEKAGVERIPIDRAMQLIAQRGLPTTPKTGSFHRQQ